MHLGLGFRPYVGKEFYFQQISEKCSASCSALLLIPIKDDYPLELSVTLLIYLRENRVIEMSHQAHSWTTWLSVYFLILELDSFSIYSKIVWKQNKAPIILQMLFIILKYIYCVFIQELKFDKLWKKGSLCNF